MADTGGAAKDPLDDPRLGDWGVAVEAYSRAMARLQADLVAECDLPPTWFEVLLRLARSPEGRLRMTELAAQVSFTSGGFTRLADRIEAAGLLQRQPCPGDRRAALAVITEAGRETVAAAAQVHVRGLQEYVFNHFTPADRAGWQHAAEAIRAAQSAPGQPRPPDC